MKKKKILNLTQHDVVIVANDKRTVFKPVTDQEVKLAYKKVIDDDINGLPVYRHILMNGKTALPAQEEDTIYIVSNKVLKAFPYRRDLVKPVHIERDSNGELYAKGFSRK